MPEKDRLVLTPALRVAPLPEEEGGDCQPSGASAPAEPTDEDAQDRQGEASPGDEPWSDPEATLFEAARAASSGNGRRGGGAEPPVGSAGPHLQNAARAATGDAIRQEGENPWPAVQGGDEGADPHESSSDRADPVAAGKQGDTAGEAGFEAGGEDFPAPEAGEQGEIVPLTEEAAPDEAASPLRAVDATAADGGGQATPASSADRVGEDDLAVPGEGAVRLGEDVAEAGVAEDDPAAAAARAETLAAKIQALEAAIGRSRDMWEPDGAGGDDYAGTPVQTIAWEDHKDVREEDVAGADAESETDILVADEAVLDEASLRELVSEIVREELQGALGERITRNVRKLVRREIHRALAMRNFE